MNRDGTAVAMVVAALFFMESFDSTVIGTALPAMAETFGREPTELSVGLTAYLLALAVCIPVSGWVAERVGPRQVFATAIVLYVIASVLCGLAGDLGTFTLARLAQGAAGALLIPVGRLVVLRTATPDGLLRAIAFITWPTFAAPAIGPPVGGFLATSASWRWIFFVNVPLGIVGLVATLRYFPRSIDIERRRFDVVGFVLLASACCLLMYGLEMLSREGAPVAPYTGAVLVSAMIGWLAIRHLRRAANPLVDLAPFRLRAFMMPMRGGSFFRISVAATPFLLPLLFQVGLGMSALRSGLLVLAMFVGNLTMKPVTTWVLRRYGFRNVLLVNGVLSAVSIAACATFDVGTPTWVIVAVLFLGGVFRSAQATSQITLTFADVPQRMMASASTLSSIVVQLSLAAGVAVGALAVRVVAAIDPSTAGTAGQFRWAFVIVGSIGLLALLDTRHLERDVGAHVSHHRRARRPTFTRPDPAAEGA